MQHYSLWLDRYERRREQILENWSGLARDVEGLRDSLPVGEIFKRLEPLEGTAGRACFVDGGEGLTELLGLGIFFIRASGLVLNGAGEEGEELFVRDLDMNIIAYDERIKDRVDLLRDVIEFDVALRCAKEQSPDILFLDGSLHVKAGKRALDCMEYDLYRKKYTRLLAFCKKEGIRVVGVSEDSRSRLLSRHISETLGIKFPPQMTDSTILKILSDDGPYRTMEFTPRNGSENSIRIADSISSGYKTAYMQPDRVSNPLRIDVPSWEEDFDGVLGIIAGLCKGSGRYGYPIPLYLAHLDAHISHNQMEWAVRQLTTYLSKRDNRLANAVLKHTRRSERPK